MEQHENHTLKILIIKLASMYVVEQSTWRESIAEWDGTGEYPTYPNATEPLVNLMVIEEMLDNLTEGIK